MQVYQIRIKLYFLKDIFSREIIRKITAFIDQALVQDESLAEFHKSRNYKLYTFDSGYPVPKDKIYKKEGIYTVTIRTVVPELAEFFSEKLIHTHTDELKGLTGEIKIIPRRPLEMIYSLTPVIVKTEEGYWKRSLSFQEYEE